MKSMGGLGRVCADTQDHLERVRKTSPGEQREFARGCDWNPGTTDVLGWIMAQRHVDLTTAVCVFLNGQPERFNYFSKRDVPEGFAAECRLLDNICQRINCGFYLPGTSPGPELMVRVRSWMAAQAEDRAEAKRGRWVLGDEILVPVLGCDENA